MKALKLFGIAAAAMGMSPACAETIEQLLPRLDGIMADYAAAAPMPGMVYGVVKDGRLIHVKGFGVQDLETKTPVSADSRFRIASMSKAFTALAILKLRDEGKLRLDDPAEKYVPEMKGWRYPTADSPRITVRDLLTHTAGFVEDNPWGDRQQVLPEAEFTAMLKAGVQENALPSSADATIQCRVFPGESTEQVRSAIAKAAGDPGIKVTLLEPVQPAPETVPDPKVMGSIANVVHGMWGKDIPVMPTMAAGASDSIFTRAAGMPSYGVGGGWSDMDDVRAHGRDERDEIGNFYQTVEFTYRLMKELTTAK